jgi:very-short-patch-repair endonuclease
MDPKAIIAGVRKMGLQQQLFEAALRGKRNGDLSAWFGGIRKIYELEREAIDAQEYEAYIVDWCSAFTPIETDVWFSIRTLGLNMYPQYPVGRYFVDFADPVFKFAIECDGREWHDKDRDDKRDAELRKLGWRVLHIPGWKCRRDEFDPEGSHQLIRGHFGLPQSFDFEECDGP